MALVLEYGRQSRWYRRRPARLGLFLLAFIAFSVSILRWGPELLDARLQSGGAVKLSVTPPL